MPYRLRVLTVVLVLLACLVGYVRCGPGGEVVQEGEGSSPSTTRGAPQGDSGILEPLAGDGAREAIARDRGAGLPGLDPRAPATGGALPAESEAAGISGRLQLADGTPLSGYRVQLLRVVEVNTSSAAWAESGPDGSFGFTGLVSGGRYLVSPRGGRRGRSLRSSIRL